MQGSTGTSTSEGEAGLRQPASSTQVRGAVVGKDSRCIDVCGIDGSMGWMHAKFKILLSAWHRPISLMHSSAMHSEHSNRRPRHR